MSLNGQFNLTELASNVVACYLGRSAMRGNLALTAEKQNAALRMAVANATYQGGWMLPQVKAFLNKLGIQEQTAVQSVFQGGALWLQGQVGIFGGKSGFVDDLITGTVGAYGGNAIATYMPKM